MTTILTTVYDVVSKGEWKLGKRKRRVVIDRSTNAQRNKTHSKETHNQNCYSNDQILCVGMRKIMCK